MTPKWYPKSEFLSGVLPLVAPLVAQTVFVIKKWAPSTAKVLPRLENGPKITQKSPPSANMSRRNARSAYNNHWKVAGGK